MTPALESKIRSLPSLIPYLNESEKRKAIELLEQYDLKQQRIECESSLLSYVPYAWRIIEPKPFVMNWHIKTICDHLEAVVRGDIKKLLINVPPGCMKSLLTMVFLPSWVWGPYDWPEARFMSVSYKSTLSQRDSIKARNIILSDWYQGHWKDKFSFVSDQNAKTKYENNRTGWRLPTSIGGAGTGEHPDFILIDDPHNVHESESEAERESGLEWIDGTLSTRGQILDVRTICIMQRLHDEDASGHFLKQGGWEHLKIPMEYEPDTANGPTCLDWVDPRTEAGELLWPSMFTREKVDAMTISMGESRAAGQFQQRPPEHYEQTEWPRSYFDDDRIWFDEWPDPSEVTLKVIALDPSKGKTKTADYSAFVIIYLTTSGIMYVDAVMDRWDYRRITTEALQLGLEHQPDGFVIESNLYQGVLSDMISEESKKTGFGLPIYQDYSKVNKIERIRRLTPYLSRFDCRFKRGSNGAALLVNQLKSFPSGKHDDGPDAMEKAVELTRRLWSSGPD